MFSNTNLKQNEPVWNHLYPLTALLYQRMYRYSRLLVSQYWSHPIWKNRRFPWKFRYDPILYHTSKIEWRKNPQHEYCVMKILSFWILLIYYLTAGTKYELLTTQKQKYCYQVFCHNKLPIFFINLFNWLINSLDYFSILCHFIKLDGLFIRDLRGHVSCHRVKCMFIDFYSSGRWNTRRSIEDYHKMYVGNIPNNRNRWLIWWFDLHVMFFLSSNSKMPIIRAIKFYRSSIADKIPEGDCYRFVW